MKICLNCNSETENQKYCSNQCQKDFEYKIIIEKWLRGEISGINGKNGIKGWIRKYLIQKYGEKCSICGWNKIHPITGNVPIEIDHIDGKHINNKPENLRLICPNCHSLTSTFRNLNHGKSTRHR